MKLQVDLDGREITLEFHKQNSSALEYVLAGAVAHSGQASVIPVMPGVYSVLLGSRSVQVALARKGAALEIWVNGRLHSIELVDPRDRIAGAKKSGAAGPVEIRSQMPGRVIKLLVDKGASVALGQPVIIVEAMKMQNEMKSPKDGTVVRIQAAEGGTVAAGETLLVIE